MERSLLLNQLDPPGRTTSNDGPSPSGIGLVGYAQIDPKTEYKREGMKEFDTMWDGVGDKVTETVFRMEDDEALPGIGLGHRPDDPRSRPARPPPTALAGQQQAAIAGSQRATRSTSRSATAARRSAATTRALRQRQEVQELPHARWQVVLRSVVRMRVLRSRFRL